LPAASKLLAFGRFGQRINRVRGQHPESETVTNRQPRGVKGGTAAPCFSTLGGLRPATTPRVSGVEQPEHRQRCRARSWLSGGPRVPKPLGGAGMRRHSQRFPGPARDFCFFRNAEDVWPILRTAAKPDARRRAFFCCQAERRSFSGRGIERCG